MWESTTDHHQPSQSSVESYTWKYGRVTVTDNSITNNLQLSQIDLLITTQPFHNAHANNSRAIFVESCEENKCLETVDWICQQMLAKGVNRESTVYIQGGGLLLDMAGFACSIFMRGVKKVVYIPTTLLAIVDATVGGKTGINWGGAKNMLGVTRHAHEIWVSLHYLDSLSDKEFSNGLAEVIKMAITHDLKLFELLQSKEVTLSSLRSSKSLLRQIVKRSLEIKMKVVEGDQFDRNERKWLNFGHTVGHALQMSEAGMGLKHGECVALGILEQLKIGQLVGQIEDKNIRSRVEAVFKKFNLPTKLPREFNSWELVSLMAKDKKNVSSGGVELTLIDNIGTRKISTTPVSMQKLQEHFAKGIDISVRQGATKDQIKQGIEAANIKWLKERKFPGSKSLSIRYLFLSALSFLKNRQKIIINNFLESEDTLCMIQSLKALGFQIEFDSPRRCLEIYGYKELTEGKLNVGNSGLTARFILPLCAHLKGEWTIECHPRMSERPNKQIFTFCTQHYNCQFEWTHGRQNSFPTKIKTKGLNKQSLVKPIELTSQESSQFISSVLLNSYLLGSRRREIRVPPGKLVSQSYILMTIDCLNNFGGSIFIEKDTPKKPKTQFNSIFVSFFPIFNVSEVNVEQDLSSYSYPYALGLIHQAKTLSPPLQSTQGDKQFYEFCQQLLSGQLPHNLDFSECTDTFMTMAAILATNHQNRFKIGHRHVQMHGIANQRIKESNRIKLTKDNLQKIGYHVQETEDGLILPIHNVEYRKFRPGEVIVFETAGDHRLAMSMAILSTYLNANEQIKKLNVKFVIDDKDAVGKTFPEFWHYLKDTGIQLSSFIQLPKKSSLSKPTPQAPLSSSRNKSLQRTLLMGNRGSGKTTIARILCNQIKDTLLVDLDQEITKRIVEEHSPLKSIAQFVESKGWDQFRKIQYEELQKYGYSDHLEKGIENKYGHVIVSLGGGTVDWPSSNEALARKKDGLLKVYLEKRLQDLQIVLNDKRPYIPNFGSVYSSRSQKYEETADYIITIPSQKNKEGEYNYSKINEYILSEFGRVRGGQGQVELREGFIYCVPRVYGGIREPINWQDDQEFKADDALVDVSALELRVDAIAQQLIENEPALASGSDQKLLKRLRYAIAEFKLTNLPIVKNLPIITTLRTKQQFGLFPFKPVQNINESYHSWVEALHKVPSNYMDYQFALGPADKVSQLMSNNKSKYMFSYHGQSLTTINQLISLYTQTSRQGHLTKLCYKGPEHFWHRHSSKWQKHSDICVNLSNPMTRLANRLKMVIRESDRSGVIRIPTRKQLEILAKVGRLFL